MTTPTVNQPTVGGFDVPGWATQTEFWARWAGKFHRARWSGRQGEKLRGWNLVSYCGAWENLSRARIHHQRLVRDRFRIADKPRREARCLNCTTHTAPSRDSGWKTDGQPT